MNFFLPDIRICRYFEHLVTPSMALGAQFSVKKPIIIDAS